MQSAQIPRLVTEAINLADSLYCEFRKQLKPGFEFSRLSYLHGRAIARCHRRINHSSDLGRSPASSPVEVGQEGNQ